MHNGEFHWMTYSLFIVPPCVITPLLSKWRPRRGYVGESRLLVGQLALCGLRDLDLLVEL